MKTGTAVVISDRGSVVGARRSIASIRSGFGRVVGWITMTSRRGVGVGGRAVSNIIVRVGSRSRGDVRGGSVAVLVRSGLVVESRI